MKQEIIADLSRITEEEQAILDGKTEVEKERYSSGQKFVMDAGKLLERAVKVLVDSVFFTFLSAANADRKNGLELGGIEAA